MGSIQVLTDRGLKTVLFDGDQPSPRDMARMRQEFQYEQQLPMDEMGGTQTIPMTPTHSRSTTRTCATTGTQTRYPYTRTTGDGQGSD